MLNIHDITNGAGVTAGGTPTQQTTITTHDVGDGTSFNLGSSITSFTAARVGAGSIVAPSLGTLTVKGDSAASIPGSFADTLTLSGAGLLTGVPTLRTATIAGDLLSPTWSVTGTVGTVTVGGNTSNWALGSQIAPVSAVTSITLGTVGTANLYVSTKITTLKAIDWGDGSVNAGSIGTLGVTGKAAVAAHNGIPLVPAISGDFGANVSLTQNGLATGMTLGTATIAGNLTSPLWDVTGDLGYLTVGLTAGGTATAPMVIHATHNIWSLTLGAAIHADFWAGMNTVPPARHAVIGTTFDDPLAAIKSITVKGWAVPAHTTPPAFFADSNFSAAKLPIANILNVQTDNGQVPFGFWANSITSVTVRDNRVSPTTTWTWPKQNPTPDLTIQIV
jgi:hypothetical protein